VDGPKVADAIRRQPNAQQIVRLPAI